MCKTMIKTILVIFINLLISLNIIASETDFIYIKNNISRKSIPLINILVDIDKISKEDYTEGKIEIASFQENTNILNDTFLCKIKYRGASSLAYEKKSFAVKLYDDNWNNLDHNLFGIRKTNKWILDAMAIDRIRMRNRICFDIWNEFSQTPYDTDYERRNGTKGSFVEVFVNGEYHGLYCLTDKIERKLLGLKKPKEQSDGNINIRGILYKCNHWGDAAFLTDYREEIMDNVEWNNWELQEPEDYPSAETWTPLKELIDFCKNSNNSFFATNYTNHFYKDNLIDYGLLLFAFNIRDNLMKNTLLSVVDINENKRFLITPWDLDTSLGGEYNGEYYDYDALFSLVFGWAQPYYRLYNENVDNFFEDMKNKWMSLSNSVMSKENINNKIDKYTQQFIVSGAWQREYAKWNNNPVPLEEDLSNEISYVKNWYSRNFENVTYLFNNTNYIQHKTYDINDEIISVYNVNGVLIYKGNEKGFTNIGEKKFYIIKNKHNTKKHIIKRK